MNIQNLSDIELLNLKKEDLQGLSKEQLNELLILAENKENLYNTQQLVEKLLINSLYGALANKYFSLFNEDMAAAITGNGRYFIQKLANYIENKLQSLLPSKKPYIIYGDTDSVIGSTLIKTENGDIKIEDIYENIKGNIEIRNEDNFIKHICEHIKAASVSKNKELEYNNINYIMKHKVKKRMYKIKCDNDEVIITEDHSMMVVRNNNLIEIKPKDVLKTDKLIKINTILKDYNNFEIEDLGIQEEWVYDIEVEKNHNFFGNNILVHNSVYFHIEPFMEKYQEKNPDLSINEYVEWADNFEKKIIQPIIQQCIDDFSKQLNAYNKDSIGAEREIISDTAVFSAKKKYFARVRDSEGTRYPENDPYIKVMGLEISKSSTPLWAKKKLKESIPQIFDKNENNLKQWVTDIKQEYIKENLNNLAQVGGVSNLNYNLDTDKGIPIGSRAALIHNKYVIDKKLDNKYTLIQAGDKCKKLFLVEPNPFGSNIIAYTNDEFVEELKDYIDFDTNFEKGFLSALNLMVESLNYNLNKKTEVLDEW